MSDFTPPNGTPKDINNRLCGVKGLDPEDLNDTAFKLVTIYRVFCCVEKTHLFFLFFVNSTTSPPQRSLSIHYPAPPPQLTSSHLGGRVLGTGN